MADWNEWLEWIKQHLGMADSPAKPVKPKPQLPSAPRPGAGLSSSGKPAAGSAKPATGPAKPATPTAAIPAKPSPAQSLPTPAKPEPPSPVSKTFVDRFNQAAGLAREGKHERAIKLYETIFEPFPDPDEERRMSGDFFVEVFLRKAYCFMDLKKYHEALETFENPELVPLLEQALPPQLYSYFHACGNTLGAMGATSEMEQHLSKAVRLATENMKDQQKTDDCRNSLRMWSETVKGKGLCQKPWFNRHSANDQRVMISKQREFPLEVDSISALQAIQGMEFSARHRFQIFQQWGPSKEENGQSSRAYFWFDIATAAKVGKIVAQGPATRFILIFTTFEPGAIRKFAETVIKFSPDGVSKLRMLGLFWCFSGDDFTDEPTVASEVAFAVNHLNLQGLGILTAKFDRDCENRLVKELANNRSLRICGIFEKDDEAIYSRFSCPSLDGLAYGNICTDEKNRKIFASAFEQGDPEALFDLACWYTKGDAVLQDMKEAERLYIMAAEQGLTKAQVNLGLMYFQGTGVPQDLDKAYMWSSLAALADPNVASNKATIGKSLNPQQIEQAHRLVKTWKKKSWEELRGRENV